MNTTLRKILVVGGNGFIGSAVCKAALGRGVQVTSLIRAAIPHSKGSFTCVDIQSLAFSRLRRSRTLLTRVFHSSLPSQQVDWQQGNALQPESFAHLFPQVDGVVHTLGTLIEDTDYKRAVKEGDLPGLFGAVFLGLLNGGGNPLQKRTAPSENPKSYESMNRDSALRVCAAFLSSPAEADSSRSVSARRPFIYISAEDIFRPVISSKYIETKREAERGIEQMIQGRPGYRGVYMRPSLVYHAHFRPLTTPPAALLDLSATIHSKIPAGIPTPSSVLRSLGSSTRFGARGSSSEIDSSSALESIANALVLPPIHVDHVADAICAVLDSRNDAVEGVVGVQKMFELIGWARNGGETRSGVSESLTP